MRYPVIVLGLALAVIVPPTLAAEGVDPAVMIQTLRSRAEHGDIGAQAQIGRIYESGQGVRQDLVEAARWYRLAAEQGNAAAQASLDRLTAAAATAARRDRQ